MDGVSVSQPLTQSVPLFDELRVTDIDRQRRVLPVELDLSEARLLGNGFLGGAEHCFIVRPLFALKRHRITGIYIHI